MKKAVPDNQPPHLRNSIEDRDLNEDEQHQITNKGKEEIHQKSTKQEESTKKKRKNNDGKEFKPLK